MHARRDLVQPYLETQVRLQQPTNGVILFCGLCAELSSTTCREPVRAHFGRGARCFRLSAIQLRREMQMQSSGMFGVGCIY